MWAPLFALLAAAAAASFDTEYCIIGAGPGGLQLGYFLKQAGLDYVIFEKSGSVGHFYQDFPRHGKLISINKRFTGRGDPEFNLRHDWNSLLGDFHPDSPKFRDFSTRFFPRREEMVEYLVAYQDFHQLNVKLNTPVTRVVRDAESGLFTLTIAPNGLTSDLICRFVVVATGFRKPNIPAMPGIELAVGYDDVPTDPAAFLNKTVLILGLGNSAFETAEHMSENGAAYVHVLGRSVGGLRRAYVTHYVGDLRAVNDAVVDTFFLKSLDTIDVGLDIRNASLRKAENGKIYLETPSKVYHYRDGYDMVVRCVGWKFDLSIFDASASPALMGPADKYPLMTANYESVNVPGMFFVGTLQHAHDWRMAAGGFIHGFRYLARYLARAFLARFHSTPMNRIALDPSAQGVARAFSKRMQTSSALYQMFGVLCDLVFWNPSKGRAFYVEEIMCDMSAVQSVPEMHWWTMNFEYGHAGPNGQADNSRATHFPGLAYESQFLHPLIIHYRSDTTAEGATSVREVSRFYIMEDFLASWDFDPIHHDLLLEYIERCMVGDYRSQEQIRAEFFQEAYVSLSPADHARDITIGHEFYGSHRFLPSTQAPDHSEL